MSMETIPSPCTGVTTFGGLSLIKKDGSRSQKFPLVERRYLFGRQEHCDIRINLLNVSREHAEIVVDEEDQVIALKII
jgi:pSer/pThr/pTyr-binding forkhead associated (FHA) protein